MSDGPPIIFDRQAYCGRRSRAARENRDAFLAREAAEHIGERLAVVNRRFTQALDLGSRGAYRGAYSGHADHWVCMDPADAAAPTGDEEHLPFAPESFDLVVSVLALHAVNDLPGTLAQIRRVLKPDGLFLAALFGGETLKELRTAFAAAEAETLGGVSPRVSPFADVRDFGALLQRAGFALPVADTEATRVRYRKLSTLFADLRAHGETNALAVRRLNMLSRATLAALSREYGERFSDNDGKLLASFDVIYLTGWAPHESQQKPLKPGSAKTRLADALGTVEHKTGEKPE
jgi:SAM-dependent methyltransferase